MCEKKGVPPLLGFRARSSHIDERCVDITYAADVDMIPKLAVTCCSKLAKAAIS
jgi:hypothetical protein